LSHILVNIFPISSTTVKDIAIKEGLIDRKYLIIICTLSLNSKVIPTHALIDCRATGYAFIDQDFANHHQLSLYPLKTAPTLKVINRGNISLGDITPIIEG
jgi:hypothetical protein